MPGTIVNRLFIVGYAEYQHPWLIDDSTKSTLIQGQRCMHRAHLVFSVHWALGRDRGDWGTSQDLSGSSLLDSHWYLRRMFQAFEPAPYRNRIRVSAEDKFPRSLRLRWETRSNFDPARVRNQERLYHPSSRLGAILGLRLEVDVSNPCLSVMFLVF